MFGNDCLAFGILKKNPRKMLGKPPKSRHYYVYFSNSLIIHQAKTKEITTLKEVLYPVLISIDFGDFTSRFTT